MELSEPVFVPNHDHQLNQPQLGLQSSPPSPDLDPPPSDLNHAAALQEDLQNLDLGEAEAEEKVENKDEECESDDTINDRNENENGNDNDNYENDNNDNDNDNDNDNNDTDSNNNNSGSEIRKRYPFPVRPDAEDCPYYMKTGTCKFGSNCKFNHPLRRKNQAAKEKVKEREDSLERLGQGQSQRQIECKYYLRTGGCKYGKACRYNHTRAKSAVLPILELNFLGLPIRMGEIECPYYMRNGSCKYGVNCKFNHPDPTAVGSSDPPSGFGNGGSVSSQAASQASVGSWSSPRALNDTASFVPMMFSPTQGVTAQNSEWNGYQAPLYPPPERNMHPAPAYVMNNPAMESTVYTHNQPHILADEFPERPGQPECSYFLKTGDCKFKSNCKYHHPKNQISKSPTCALSDKGLPLRPVSVLCFLSSASYGCYMCLGNNFEDHSHVGSKIKMEVLEQIQWFSKMDRDYMTSCPTSVTDITPGLLLKYAAYGAAAYVYYELFNYLSLKDWCVHYHRLAVAIVTEEKASTLFLKYLSWKQSFVPNGYISPSEITNQVEDNKVCMQGHDKKGRPIVVAFGGRHNPSKGSLEDFKHSFC